jgi:hypothetical protein
MCESGSTTGSFESNAKGSDKSWIWFTIETFRTESIVAGKVSNSDSLSCEKFFESKFPPPGYTTLEMSNPIEAVQEVASISDKAGCLISTATFGTELAPQVQMLREIRDQQLLQTSSGISFMSGFNQFYYSFSPAVSDLERQSPIFRELVKVTISPMLSTLSILQFADVDSEQEILGYGIGIILLNIGMYLVLPVFLIVRVNKLRKNIR